MSNQPGSTPNQRLLRAEEMTQEQLTLLEKIEKLAELDPEITGRLTQMLDRLQVTRPYQPAVQYRQDQTRQTTPVSELSEAEKALREKFITQELSSLLAIAGKLSGYYQQASNREVKPDRQFKEYLRNQLFQKE